MGPLVGAAVASAAGGVMSSGFNAGMQGKTNRKTRIENRKMYEWQRRDALADWNMQNEYNDPSAQMARLRKAGLNPNLVYGNGADVTSGQVRNVSPGSWNPTAPQIDPGVIPNAVMGFYDIQMREAQIENMKTNNQVMQADAASKVAGIIATMATVDKTKAETLMTEFDLLMKNQMQDLTLDQASANLAQTRANTKSVLDENERRAAMQAPNLKIAAETILKMRLERAKTAEETKEIQHRITNLSKDEILKQLDINLKRMGIQPGDPAWMRAATQIVNQVDLPAIKDKIQSWKPGENSYKDKMNRINRWLFGREMKYK